MFCENCGKKLNDDAKFCPQCGKPTGRSGEVRVEEPKPDYKKTVRIIVLLLLLAVIVAGGVTLFKADRNADAKNEAAQRNAKVQETLKKEEKHEEPEDEEEIKEPAVPAVPLNISVQQIDASMYPKIRIYLRMEDTVSGKIPENLESKFFYIKSKNITEEMVKEKIGSAGQLNEKQALKINMVADVSGSMDGSPLMNAKEKMANFIGSVQFGAGDQVELISFATGVRLEQEFTQDAQTLISDVNMLSTGDMTSLYDALYTAVGRTAAQTGAKCVIAFTDGEDNYSSCSAQDVADLAARYHIPVFIIGVGGADYTEVSDLAFRTGGAYYNIYDIVSIQDIYNEIYQLEKELYYIEYEDTSGKKITDQMDIQVGYSSPEYTGECIYSYVPNTLLSVDADAFYTTGPEAVVEQYLKNFDDAMNYADFSYISDYLLPGSQIYTEQEKYVTRGIKEQLDSYEIVKVENQNADHSVVTTRETFLVQISGEPLFMMTQECSYNVENTSNGWKMTSFAGPVNVLSKINR